MSARQEGLAQARLEVSANPSEADAIAALESLGFRTAEATRAVAQALRDVGEGQSTPALIRESLKRASR